MQIILVAILIYIIMRAEVWFYAEHILPCIGYNCRLSIDEVEEGDTAQIIETVSNPTRCMIPCIKSEITTSKYLEFAENISKLNDKNRTIGSMFSMNGKQKITRSWKVKCTKRGVYRVQDTTIVAMDLLNIYKHSDLVKLRGELVVLPKAINVGQELLCCKENQGERVVKRFILQDPFVIAGVREYTSRDSMSQVHWKLSARHNELMVRNNEATANKSILVALNIKAYMEQDTAPIENEKVEKAIRISAGVFREACSQNFSIQFITNAPLRGKK